MTIQGQLSPMEKETDVGIVYNGKQEGDFAIVEHSDLHFVIY